VANGIDGALRTYKILKANGIADGYTRTDNNPSLGQPRGILEGGPEVSADVAGANGKDRGPSYASDVQTPRRAEGARQGQTSQADLEKRTAPPAVRMSGGACLSVEVIRAPCQDLSNRMDGLTPEDSKWLRTEFETGRRAR